MTPQVRIEVAINGGHPQPRPEKRMGAPKKHRRSQLAGKVRSNSRHLAHRNINTLRPDALAMGKVSSMKSDLAQIVPPASSGSTEPQSERVDHRLNRMGIIVSGLSICYCLPASGDCRSLPTHFCQSRKHWKHQYKAQAIEWAVSVPAKPGLAWLEHYAFSRDSWEQLCVPAGFQVRRPGEKGPRSGGWFSEVMQRRQAIPPAAEEAAEHLLPFPVFP